MTASPTKILAEYVSKTRFSDLSGSVVRQVKRCVLDSLGCALGGCKTESGRIIVDTAEYLGGNPQSTIFGSGSKTSCTLASFANSTLANALDFDDTYMSHPGATVIPPAIAVAETMKRSGSELVTAIVIGYEILTRLADALLPSPKQIWEVRGLGTFQTFGAAAVASKLLKLNVQQILNALGIAGANAPVPSIAKTVHTPLGVTMVKNNFGTASEVGVAAALLARNGFTGPEDILDGARGFWRMYGSDRCDFDRITDKLGEVYEIMNIEFKPYPACRGFHSAIDAAANIVQSHRITAEDIEQITVRLPSVLTVPPFNNPKPETFLDAEFSIPYAISAAIIGVEPGLDWFTPQTLASETLLTLASRVKLVVDAHADQVYPMRRIEKVEILAGGKRYVKQVEFARGSPRNPLTDEQLVRKFVGLASSVVGREQAYKIKDVVDRLDEIEDITKLTNLLAG